MYLVFFYGKKAEKPPVDGSIGSLGGKFAFASFPHSAVGVQAFVFGTFKKAVRQDYFQRFARVTLKSIVVRQKRYFHTLFICRQCHFLPEKRGGVFAPDIGNTGGKTLFCIGGEFPFGKDFAGDFFHQILPVVSDFILQSVVGQSKLSGKNAPDSQQYCRRH